MGTVKVEVTEVDRKWSHVTHVLVCALGFRHNFKKWAHGEIGRPIQCPQTQMLEADDTERTW